MNVVAIDMHSAVGRIEHADYHLDSRCLARAVGTDKPLTAWQRISDNFEMLYDVPENVAELRKSILQLAVQGKLVPQDPNDEPALELLKKIEVEKRKLVKEGKIRKPKPPLRIESDELPFDLPSKWEWVRLGSISVNIHYGYNASADVTNKEVRLLRITDIQNDRVDWETVPGCKIESSKLRTYALAENDILIARTGGTIGKSYLVSELPVTTVFASYLIRFIPHHRVCPRFVKVFLGSQLYWDHLYERSMGTGQPNVNGTALKSLIIPIPPLKEQKRIVAKVDQLMAMCDELERKLQEGQSLASEITSATLHRLLSA